MLLDLMRDVAGDVLGDVLIGEDVESTFADSLSPHSLQIAAEGPGYVSLRQFARILSEKKVVIIREQCDYHLLCGIFGLSIYHASFLISQYIS